MKTKTKYPRFSAILLSGLLLMGILSGCQNGNATENKADTETPAAQPTEQTPSETSNSLADINLDVEPSRANYVALAEELAQLYQQSPTDSAVALTYAEKLLQLGDVSEAEEVLTPFLAAAAPDPQAIYLAAQAAYYRGRYEEAESLYSTLLQEYPSYTDQAENGLAYVYYQTNQYQKVQALSEPVDTTGIGAMMRAFAGREPYQVSWEGSQEATIPFLVTDPLPVIQAEINGELRNFILDTGAGETYLNQSVAQALGIQGVASQVGGYAGGVVVETTYGIVDSLRFDGVTLSSLPVHIAEMDHLAYIAGEDLELSGIIGTSVFRQFCTTMDYLNGALRLTPRGTEALVDDNAVEMPFLLTNTHFMLCRATVNGKEMNMHMDSGLAQEESLLLSSNIMAYAGIALPEMEVEDDGVGGLGGNDFPVGYFRADTFQLGNLPTVSDLPGVVGIMPEPGYLDETLGIFDDGIISHSYFKDFIWTIDFDTMTMTFAQ